MLRSLTWGKSSLGAADALSGRAGAFLPVADSAGFERSRADIRDRLGEERFGAAFAAGKALPTEEAIAEARRLAHAMAERDTPRAPDDPLARLSSRERQVLRLVAEGRTAREIAATLFISHRTVEGHMPRAAAS